jgi:hypothetical protein
MIVKFLSVPVVFFIVITIATLAVCLVIIVVVGETIVKISDHRNKKVTYRSVASSLSWYGVFLNLHSENPFFLS